MTPALFRTIVIASVLFAVGSGIVDTILAPLPADNQATDAELWLVASLVAATLVLAIVMTIGLLRFSWWARPLALWGTVAGLAALPFLDPIVSAMAETLSFASNVLVGATLAAAYWSPIAARFER